MKKRNRSLKYRERLRKFKHCGEQTNARCPFCGNHGIFYYYRYDADCCPSCDTWLESACGDPECTYCANRPETPLAALFFEPDPIPFSKDSLREKYRRRYSGALRQKNKYR